MQDHHIQLTTDEMLTKMAAVFKERNATYGSNYNAVADVMMALFPNGLTLNTHEDFIKFHFFDWTIGKFTRFVKTDMTHIDSALDGAVYMAMLADLVTKLEDKKVS